MKNSAKYSSSFKIKILYITGFALFVFSALLGVAWGSTGLSFNIFSPDTTESVIFYFVRIPRVLASIFCGGALAISGVVIQAVLSNPLASPSIIGVNSGAGLAVTLCTAFGIFGGWKLSLFSFLGAFLTVMLVSLGAKKWGASRGTVILMGVATNSILTAFSETVVTFFPEVGVMSHDFKLGEFSAVTYEKLIPAIVIISTATVFLLFMTNELNVLSTGEENARALGMNTPLMRVIFLLMAALLAGTSVSIAGLLSFVGLIIPHAVRRFTGNGAFHLTVLSFIFGGGFVCLSDTLARTIFSPFEIPVGIIMSFLGAPFFIYVLLSKRGWQS